MANYQYTSDLIADVLWRASELTDGTSDFTDAVVLRYMNRALQAIAMGGTEFDPHINEEWWWLRAEGSLILNPVVDTGTASVTNNNTSVTLSSAPAADMTGRFFKVDGFGDVFVISSHIAGNPTITLDTVYTGSTDTAAAFKIFQLDYSLPSDCLKVISPMQGFQKLNGFGSSDFEIHENSVKGMQREWPMSLVRSGVPDQFAPIAESTIRFNRYGGTSSTELKRIDFDYLVRPATLTNDTNEECEIPLQYRYVLADATLLFILTDKDESKAGDAGLMARQGIRAMSSENRHRMAQAGRAGSIQPRQSYVKHRRGPLRTESGTIIG